MCVCPCRLYKIPGFSWCMHAKCLATIMNNNSFCFSKTSFCTQIKLSLNPNPQIHRTYTFYQFSLDAFTFEPINDDFTANSMKIHFLQTSIVCKYLTVCVFEPKQPKVKLFSNLICIVDDIQASCRVLCRIETKMHETHCKLNNYYTWYISVCRWTTTLCVCLCVRMESATDKVHTAKQRQHRHRQWETKERNERLWDNFRLECDNITPDFTLCRNLNWLHVENLRKQIRANFNTQLCLFLFLFHLILSIFRFFISDF